MENEILIKEINTLISRVDNAIKRQEQDIKLILSLEAEMDIMFWQVIHRWKGGETLEDTKRNFFHRMANATGDLRVLQEAMSILLVNLDKICRSNNIIYFLCAGTLLGANRHSGFVPWDDDTDVFMLREDVEKLIDVMKDNKDFSVRSFIADFKRAPVYTRIVRFSYNDTRIGNWQSFVDIFILDWCKDTSDESWNKYLSVRNQLCSEFVKLRDAGESHDYVHNQLNEKYKIVFNNLLNYENSRSALCWGWDNFTHGSKYINEYDFVFPLTEVEFENYKFWAPKNPERYSSWRYGDWLAIPRSVNAHRHSNIDKELIDTLRDKIKQYRGYCNG